MAAKATDRNVHLIDAVIFDMDGVITKTARVHTESWKWAFDEFLQARAASGQGPFREFTREDYLRYVDGKPRLKGIVSFLKSRNITISQGQPGDPPTAATVHGIGNKKNARFLEIVQTRGAKVYEPTINLVQALQEEGIHRAVVTSSKNCTFILESAGVIDLFETRVDGVTARKVGLSGKPEGDIFVHAARQLGFLPSRCVVVEDAISGVQAGRNGAFGLVLGVARAGNARELCRHGADAVVTIMSAVDIPWMNSWLAKSPTPLIPAWDNAAVVERQYKELMRPGGELFINPAYLRTPRDIFSRAERVIFFLDYDGTLTPIVSRPELAVMPDSMRALIKRLMRKFTVAVVSGRQREDVERLVGVDDIFYAGSHGFDIRGPGCSLVQPAAAQAIPVMAHLIEGLKRALYGIPGVLVEEKKYSVAVHYRQVAPGQVSRVKTLVSRLITGQPAVRLMHGKKVLEILPQVDWNKGKAVRWIMSALQSSFADALVVYIGDDTTDEDAFRTIRGRGVGILVAESSRPSAADFQLQSPAAVETFFSNLLSL